MSELRFCFVSYEDNEQVESGDTITHTWVKPSWPNCTTKYCYFWGYAGGVLAKSTSPPFEHHNIYVPPPTFECGDVPVYWPGATAANQIHLHKKKPVTGTGTLTFASLYSSGHPNDNWWHLAMMKHLTGTQYQVRSTADVYCPGSGIFRYTISMACVLGDCIAVWGFYGSIRRQTTVGVNIASDYYYSNPLTVGAVIDFPYDSYSDPLDIYADNYSVP